MPELPEVETTVRGIRPFVEGRSVSGVIVRQRRLRWPVSSGLDRKLKGQIVHSVTRRAKYILFGFDYGTLMIHLGMSGRLRAIPADTAVAKHDHFDLVLDTGCCVRLETPGASAASRGSGATLLIHVTSSTWDRSPSEKPSTASISGSGPGVGGWR